MLEASDFEVEMAIVKPIRRKSQGSDQITAETIKAGGITIRYEIHKPDVLVSVHR